MNLKTFEKSDKCPLCGGPPFSCEMTRPDMRTKTEYRLCYECLVQEQKLKEELDNDGDGESS